MELSFFSYLSGFLGQYSTGPDFEFAEYFWDSTVTPPYATFHIFHIFLRKNSAFLKFLLSAPS